MAIEAIAPAERWVRLTKACNARCVFCADAHAFEGTLVPLRELKRELEAGRKDGFTRVNLSGGEPTLHPHFTKAVKLARLLGYADVRVTTNGRRMASRAFVRAAVSAGLTSATFSIHGHTAELHDAHTKTKGSFDEAVRGLGHALASGVDACVYVVVTRFNEPHLKAIRRYFEGLGARGVGFMRAAPVEHAWANRAELFPKGTKPRRLPPELRGQQDRMISNLVRVSEYREVVRPFVERGTKPACWGDRCPWCPLDAFCADVAKRRPNAPLDAFLDRFLARRMK